MVAALLVPMLALVMAPPAAAPPAKTPNLAANLDQCQNGAVGPPIILDPCFNAKVGNTTTTGWVNGNVNGQKAHWREGEFLTYRAKLTGLTSGQHTLRFSYDTVHGSKHAIDYIGSFDATETTSPTATTFHANRNNPCADILGTGAGSGCWAPGATPTAPAATGAIPTSSKANCGGSAGTFAGNQIAGVISLFAPSSAAASNVMSVQSVDENVSKGGGACSSSMTVTFSLAGATPPGGHTAVLAWGGHIAAQENWGIGNSATSISGSPYHMNLDMIDAVGLGSQDRALSTSAIFFAPSITTLLNGTSNNLTVNVGDPVFDTAQLIGEAANAGGTVTYTVYTDNACASVYTTAGIKTVTDGVVPNSDPVSFTSPGIYYWRAAYSGDSLNQPATSACSDEVVTVARVSPTITTLLTVGNQGTAAIGQAVTDTSLLSGATSDAGGTVTYNVYTDGTCTTPYSSNGGTKTVTNGIVPASDPVSFTAAGTYYWQAVYSGDSRNNPDTSTCGDEVVTVGKNAPTITTSLEPGGNGQTVNIGDPVNDSASLTNATTDAGGTVTYSVYSDAQCTQPVSGANPGTKTVTNGVVPDSSTVSFTAAGTYYWQAVYSGDSNNEGDTSACTEEVMTVALNEPGIVTTLSISNGGSTSIGTPVYDTAVLNGETADAGGTVTYKVYTDDQCSILHANAGTKTVTNGVVPNSENVSFSDAGTYYWQAAYSGDANNDPATSTCGDESMTVVPNEPGIVTTLSITNGGSTSIGTPVYDTAVLNGETADAGGTVTYKVYTDDQCSILHANAGTKTVTNGVVPNSDNVTFTDAGTYYWQADYSGDSNNDPATSTCGDESMTVVPNEPSFTTAQKLLPNDSAVLTGATNDAGGTITFSLYSPADAGCSGTPAYTQTVNVSGNGTYATTNNSVYAQAEGVWRWLVIYSGDDNNDGFTSACGVEAFTIDNDTTA